MRILWNRLLGFWFCRSLDLWSELMGSTSTVGLEYCLTCCQFWEALNGCKYEFDDVPWGMSVHSSLVKAANKGLLFEIHIAGAIKIDDLPDFTKAFKDKIDDEFDWDSLIGVLALLNPQWKEQFLKEAAELTKKDFFDRLHILALDMGIDLNAPDPDTKI